jgi:endogenous inhibitor of DNA gyrase (YacG/DUF329 family)
MMHPIVRETLRFQRVCPKCGASFPILEEMLNDRSHEDYYIATLMIANCPVCGDRFKEEK